jgi:hypothetical protein
MLIESCLTYAALQDEGCRSPVNRLAAGELEVAGRCGRASGAACSRFFAQSQITAGS